VIQTAHQELLARWLCERIGLMPSPHLRCIANVTPAGRILGVVGFDGWNDASCQMHVAGVGNWVTRELLHAVFDYPFNKAGLKVVLGLVPSGNDRALKFNRHLGFTEVARIPDAHPDGALVLLQMRRENCKFLRTRHGQEVISAAA